MRWEIKEKIGAGKTYKVAFGNTLQEIRPVNTLQEMPLNNIFRETNHRFPENPTGPHLKMRLEIKEKIGAGKTYKVACGNTLQEIRPVNTLHEMPLNNILQEMPPINPSQGNRSDELK